MKHKLTYVALCVFLTAAAGCEDDPPRPGPTGGMGGTGGTAGAGGMGGAGGTGGGGTGGSTDGPRSETAPNPDGPMTEGGSDAPATPMATVTPAGKRLVSADGRLSLVIPPGAFRGPVEVSITVASPAPGGALGAVYEIDPGDEPLLVPATVTIRYTAAELAGGKASDLRIGLRDGDSWLSLPGIEADATATLVQAQLSRLGVVGLLPGLCSVCDSSCVAAECKVGVSEMNPAGVAGKCVAQGMGCNKCVPMCDDDGDGYCDGDPVGDEPSGDCADDDPDRFPGAREICGNTVDDDCDTHVDEGCKVCTAHNQCTSAAEACIGGVCEVCEGGCTPSECVFGADPDTGSAGVMGRCHSFGNGCNACVPMCDADGDGYCADPNPGNDQPEGDCNDNSTAQAPNLKEVCGNGLDDDCNGSIDDLCVDCSGDDDCSRDLQVCSNGACAGCTRACTPGAACNFQVDGNPVAGKCAVFGHDDSCSRCVPQCDEDADGYCEGDPVGGEPGGDCEKNDADINPGATEICGNDEDDNCSGVTDEGCTRCTSHAGCPAGSACVDRTCETCDTTCTADECRFGVDETMPGSGVQGRCVGYAMGCQRCVPMCDADGDGFCPQAEPPSEQPGGDCDDGNVNAYPNAPEVCGNRVDDNCDGQKDEGCALTTCASSAACGANESCTTGR